MTPMGMRLQGKVAIITGAVSGLGLAATELFIAEGARVVAADVQEGVGAELQDRLGDRVSFVRCDVREEADLRAAVERAETQFGRLDVMYHNAATAGDRCDLETISVDGWDDTQAMLLRSSMLCIKHASLALRRAGGGSIILTSSAAALALGGTAPYAYTVGKAGVIAMGRYAAFQLGKDFIRVNVLVPGAFKTSIATDRAGSADEDDADKQYIPRAGRGSDIAEAALFLASDNSSFITGTAIPVDGGLTLLRKRRAAPGNS